IPAIIELDLVVELARAWASDPTWPKRLNAFREPGEFSHGILECAAASLLIAIGNDVGPQPPTKGRRTADLQCVISAADVLALEVKVPHRLQWPADGPLRGDESATLVNRALESADTGPRGQLDPTRSGILVLGGLHVPLDDAVRLRDAAKTCLLAQRRPHIAGVM